MKLKMEDMTWKEVEEALEEGRKTALVLLGSIEQHGPHLPLSTDTVISENLGIMVSERLGDALVAPIIRPGCSAHHVDFSGTISFSDDLLKQMLKEYCTSLEKHGFEYIVIIPFHGGNFDAVNSVSSDISRTLQDAKVITIADLEKSMEVMKESMNESGIEEIEEVIHAGGIETSVMLSIDEDLVDKEYMEEGYRGEVKVAELLHEGLKYFTDNGVLGDPNHADKDAGGLIMKNLAEYYVEEIRDQRD